MTKDDMRARFEAWLNSPLPGNTVGLFRKMVMSDRDIMQAWLAWQAALAASPEAAPASGAAPRCKECGYTQGFHELDCPSAPPLPAQPEPPPDERIVDDHYDAGRQEWTAAQQATQAAGDRDAFEAAYDAKCGPDTNFRRDEWNICYLDSDVQHAWWGWQAALRRLSAAQPEPTPEAAQPQPDYDDVGVRGKTTQWSPAQPVTPTARQAVIERALLERMDTFHHAPDKLAAHIEAALRRLEQRQEGEK